MSHSLASSGGGACFAHDPAPQVRPAGKIYPPDEGGVRADITQVALKSNRVETPNNVKPFRRGHAMALGSSVKHYGTRNDERRDASIVYGAKNTKDGCVDDCLKPNSNADKMGSLAAEHAERRYLSNRKEPLGRVPDPSIPLPERLLRDGFGVPTVKSENAKVVIYNATDKEAKLLHPPGEQKTRGYDWMSTNIDPTQHRFGAVVKGNPITTKELISPQNGAHVLPKIVQDFDSVAYPELAKSRNLGFGARPQNADYTYGKTLTRDGLNARQLISGVAVQEQGGYASDTCHGYNELGGTYVKSSTQRKLRSLDKGALVDSGKFGGNGRALGVPSIRTDIPKPDEAKRKVTNGVNFGDDVAAKHLLYPNQYIASGILSKYYTTPKTLEEIKAMCEKLNFGLDDAAIQLAFDTAGEGGKCTAEAFRNAVKELGL